MCFMRRKKKILSPLPETHHHMEQAASLFCQSVLQICAAPRTRLHAKNSIRNQGLKTGSQDTFGEPKIPLEFAETAHSIKRVAKDEKRPAIAHDRKRPRNWALLPSGVLSTPHCFLTPGKSIPLWFDYRTRQCRMATGSNSELDRSETCVVKTARRLFLQFRSSAPRRRFPGSF